jgi:hypothetical protein
VMVADADHIASLKKACRHLLAHHDTPGQAAATICSLARRPQMTGGLPARGQDLGKT